MLNKIAKKNGRRREMAETGRGGRWQKKKRKIELRSKNHPNVSIYFRRVHIYSINKKKKKMNQVQ